MDQVVVVDAPAGMENKPERPTMPFAPKERTSDALAFGMRKAMFPLDEGDVTLTFPEGLSADALDDLGQYLDIFLKKEQRKSGKANDLGQGNA